MKVLKLSEENLSLLDLFSYEVFERTTNKYLKYRNPYVFLISQCALFISSAGFSLRSSVDLSDWMMAMVQTIISAAFTVAFICLALKMENIKCLHDQLQGIVDDAEETEAFEIYKKNEWRCQTWTKWPLILNTGASTAVLILPSLLHSLVCMWQGNFNTSTWIFFLKFAFPFDTSNIFVWYGLMMAGTLMGTICGLIFTTIATYFMSCSFYVDACCQHFRFAYHQVEELINKDPRKTIENIPETKRRFGSLVFLHVKIIGLVNLVADIIGGVMFTLLIPCFTALTLFLYFFAETLHEMDYKLIFVQIYVMIVFFVGFPFVLCYFAENITRNLLSIADVAYNDIRWYNVPPNLSKYVLLIIQRAREPVYITGFKMVYCTLENFARCIKSAYSFYIVISEN